MKHDRLDDKKEKKFKKCNGMSDFRKNPDIRPAWEESIRAVQGLLSQRMQRLTLKDEQVQCIAPVSDVDVELIQRHVKALFNTLNLKKNAENPHF